MGSTTVWTLHFYSLFYLPRGTIESGIHEQVLEASGPPDHCLRLKIFEISNSHTELPQWLSSKESARNTGVKGLVPGSGRSPGGEHGNPLQWVTVHGVAKSQKQWKQLSMSNLHVSLEPSHERCKHVPLGRFLGWKCYECSRNCQELGQDQAFVRSQGRIRWLTRLSQDLTLTLGSPLATWPTLFTFTWTELSLVV